MSFSFGKIVTLSAAVGSAIGACYYFYRAYYPEKKDKKKEHNYIKASKFLFADDETKKTPGKPPYRVVIYNGYLRHSAPHRPGYCVKVENKFHQLSGVYETRKDLMKKISRFNKETRVNFQTVKIVEEHDGDSGYKTGRLFLAWYNHGIPRYDNVFGHIE